jgi:hypothetical protein
MNISSIAKQIGMDYDLVLEDYCGDVSIVADKLSTFVGDCAFASLEESVNNGDEENIRKGAHRIKKLSEKLGIKPLEKSAEQLENAKSSKIAALFASLKEEYLKIEKVLSAKED